MADIQLRSIRRTEQDDPPNYASNWREPGENHWNNTHHDADPEPEYADTGYSNTGYVNDPDPDYEQPERYRGDRDNQDYRDLRHRHKDSNKDSNWILKGDPDILPPKENGDIELGDVVDGKTENEKAFKDADQDNEEEEEEEEDLNCFLRGVQSTQTGMQNFASQYGKFIKYGIYCLLLLGYATYFAYATWYSFDTEDDIRLLWVTCAAAFLCLVTLIKGQFGDSISRHIISPITHFVSWHFKVFKWLFIFLVLAGWLVFVVLEVAIPQPERLVSLSGYFVYITLLFLLSTNPAKVRWRPVLWGLGFQFVMGLMTIRTQWGYDAFAWLGERVQEFLTHANVGAEFVFGETYLDHPFAFSVLPVIIYLSTVVGVLYYLGVMEAIILKLAWVMQKTLGTTAAESVNAAGNIFIGMTEAPLLIKPFLSKMTMSELHAVMVGGYSTIAGSVMASFILFGVPANHLITASVMAAPCALAMSKLSCPETEKSETTGDAVKALGRGPERNVIEAASSGASAAIKLCANIAANLIAFMSLLEFVNQTLIWLGTRAGQTNPPLTFQFICSYVLWPFAFIMGVQSGDCRKMGELIGYKIFINEFVAYTELGNLISNKEVFDVYNGTYEYINDDIYLVDTNTTLIGGIISERSTTIATYALCGFANFGSVGVVLGGLGSLAPNKKQVMARIAFRAMLVGTCVSFLNACTAGLLTADA